MAAACGQVHYSARLVKLQELFLPCRGAHWAARRVSVHWGEISPPVFLWPSPWGEGGPKGRMRGQSKEQASLEKLCRAGACPAASVHSFPGMRRGFRRCCGELLCPWRQSNQNATGDGSGWTLRVHIRLSPDPVYGGYPSGWAVTFRRAKFEWLSAIPSGPLGPGFAKIRARCGSITAPGFFQPTLPVRILAGRSGTGPYEGVKPFSSFAVGAGPRPARSSLPPSRGKVAGR